jgi:hypothetical protein
MWFGNESTGDYDTGLTESGDMTSTAINLVGTETVFLEFYHWREGEGSGWDESSVYISINGVDWDLIYLSSEDYIAPWERVSLDISAYSGNPSVQLRFNFDTIDDISNDYRGWLVDDIAIMGTGVTIPHNLRVSLECPDNIVLSTTYTINATVRNIGTSVEYDVNLFLYENNIMVDSVYISSLLSGSSLTIDYSWTPTTYGDYNFTAYAPPVSGETYTFDNVETKILPLHEVILFDGMYINYSFSIANSYSGSTQVSYTHVSGSTFHVLWEGLLSGISLQNYWDVEVQTRELENGAGNFYFGDTQHTPIWLFTDVSLSDEVPIAVDAEGDHKFLVTGDTIYDIPDFGPVEVWVVEDLTLPGGVAYYEKSTGILLSGTFFYYGGAYNYTFEIINTNAVFNKLVFVHDLRVNLGTPSYCEIYNSYSISATVINTGINDENNVDLFLYLDGIIIDSIHISNFVSGSSQTIDYSWTPTTYGEYNFTAYAPPVIGETYTTDNKRIEIIPLHKINLFDGMLANYSFTLLNNNYTIEYLYISLSNGIFHVDYTIYIGLSPYETGSWDVDSQTRILSSSLGGISFGSGTHTPLWVFTEISLNDVVPIAVASEGDHDFIVSDELTYLLPSYGIVDVWVLEDLTLPGGVAYYEKNTGTLLNGTFFYSGGSYNYTFELLNTNVFTKFLNIVLPDVSSSCEMGTSENIYWTSRGLISSVKIDLYRDDVFVMEITSETLNDGVYSWSIPTTLTTSTQYQIKITDVGDPSVSDFSEYFEIKTKTETGGIPGFNLFVLIGLIGVVSIILVKKRIKT